MIPRFLFCLLLVWNAGSLRAAESVEVPEVRTQAHALVRGVVGVYERPPTNLDQGKMPNAPVLGNGDLGVVVGGKSDHLRFYLGKSDFFGVLKGAMSSAGSLNLNIPELADASAYKLRQEVGPARIAGEFSGPRGAQLSLSSWVASDANLLVIELKNGGTQPLTITSQLLDSLGTPGNVTSRLGSGDTTSLRVSPDLLDLELGNRLYPPSNDKPGTDANAEHAFAGELADLRIYGQSLPDSDLALLDGPGIPQPFYRWTPEAGAKTAGAVHIRAGAEHGASAVFSGNPADDLWLGAFLLPQKTWTLSVWVNPDLIASGQTNLVTACVSPNQPRSHGLRLCLADGKPQITLNRTSLTASSALPPHQWSHLAARYDGTTMTLTLNDQPIGETRDFPGYDQVMGADYYSIHFGDKRLPYEGCSPRGLVVQRVVGIAASRTEEGLGFTLDPGAQATLAVALVTDRNDPDFENAAAQLVGRLDAARLADLAQTHARHWQDFWAKSYVEIPDKTIQDSWYASLYLLACCSRPECPPPGLWGNFVTVPAPHWNGDYTLNYNYEAPFWGAYACNHLELTENYEKPLLDYMPRGRAIAKKNGQSGLQYPTHLIPLPGWNNDGASTHGQKCQALFASINCLMRWRYTHDLDYAKKIYPFLIGTADYWDHYLVLKDGRYVDLKDNAAEWKESDNPATSLAFLRVLYDHLIDIGQKLDVDQDRVPLWTDILQRLSPLPIVPAASIDHLETTLKPLTPKGQPVDPRLTLADILGADLVKDRMVIRNAESGYGFPYPMVHLYRKREQRASGPGMSSCQCIYPGWAIGMESSEAEKTAALNTLTLAAQWYDFNNQCSFYPGAACAGYDPGEILENLHELIARYAYPNFIIHAGGGGTENFAVTPATLASMFAQSYQANLHVFANWPMNQNAAFGNLNACGGFLVSSAVHEGRVGYVQILSQAGEECRLVNPWPGQSVNVSSSRATARTLEGPLLVFKTNPGETVTLSGR